jgi:hypothetical protein
VAEPDKGLDLRPIRAYIRNFEWAVGTTPTLRELYDRMFRLHPLGESERSLSLSARDEAVTDTKKKHIRRIEKEFAVVAGGYSSIGFAMVSSTFPFSATPKVCLTGPVYATEKTTKMGRQRDDGDG